MEGRSINVKGANNVGYLDYDYLFNQNLGSSDYIALASHFKVIFVKNWEITGVENRNLMRRIILFVS